MAKTGDRIIIYNAGAYNSDDHFLISVKITEDGYDIASEADSLYDSSVTGARGHIPFGFFCKSSEKTVAELRKSGIIPDYFSSARIDLIPDALDELMLFDQQARFHRQSVQQPGDLSRFGGKKEKPFESGKKLKNDELQRCLRVQMIPRKTRIHQADEDCFTGEFLMLPPKWATFDLVGNNELISNWNLVCPFHTAGERWAFFYGKKNNNFPEIIVQRNSREKYRIVYQNRDYMTVNHPIEVLKLNDKPVPIQGAHRGAWHTDLPTVKGPLNQRALLYVEYYDDHMTWEYKSTISVEVGRMGRYEDDDYQKVEEHHETEFTSRETLIQQLVKFVPRYVDYLHQNSEAGDHAIQESELPDDLLIHLLYPFFR